MKHTALVFVLALAVAVTPVARASGGGGSGGGGGGGGTPTLAGTAADPQYDAAVAAIRAGRFAEGASQMQAWVDGAEAHAGSADAQNWLGYAYRKSGDLDAAFLHYDRALAIDPNHRGAHEYLGEAYLMTGNLARAEEHLKILDKLCWLPCTEFSELRTAVAEYKSAHPQTASTR